MYGFTRIRTATRTHILNIIETLIKLQHKFDFNYYLTKNCPLPSGWKELKNEFSTLERTKETRGKVYDVLFKSDSSY